MKPIPLGHFVECVVSGVKGLATSMTERLGGNVQYAVQPKSPDGVAYPDAFNIDEQSLKVTGPGPQIAAKPRECQIKVGAGARDRVSDYSGIAVAKTTYLNGCVSYEVVGKAEKNTVLGTTGTSQHFFAERLEEFGPGVLKVPTERTGGPSTRAKRF